MRLSTQLPIHQWDTTLLIHPLAVRSKFKLTQSWNVLHLAADSAGSGQRVRLPFLSCVPAHVGHSHTEVERVRVCICGRGVFRKLLFSAHMLCFSYIISNCGSRFLLKCFSGSSFGSLFLSLFQKCKRPPDDLLWAVSNHINQTPFKKNISLRVGWLALSLFS